MFHPEFDRNGWQQIVVLPEKCLLLLFGFQTAINSDVHKHGGCWRIILLLKQSSSWFSNKPNTQTSPPSL